MIANNIFTTFEVIKKDSTIATDKDKIILYYHEVVKDKINPNIIDDFLLNIKNMNDIFTTKIRDNSKNDGTKISFEDYLKAEDSKFPNLPVIRATTISTSDMRFFA